MCGRFSFAYEDFSAIIEYFSIGRVSEPYERRWNIAPSQQIPAILADGSERRFGSLTWGLRPAAWNGGGPKPINTRTETIQRNPVFRNLLQRRRVGLVATGYYEWHHSTRQPFNIRPKSREPFAFSGLWDTCELENGEAMHTCSIVTAAAPQRMKGLHDRVPVILPRQALDTWLDRTVSDYNQLMHLLEPNPEDDMEWYEVNPMVGNVRNDVPECVRPLA